MKTTLKIITLFTGMILLVMGLFAQDGFTLTGKLGGLQDGDKAILSMSDSKGQGFFDDHLLPIDTAVVRNGEFHMKGVIPQGPRRFIMTFTGNSAGGRMIDFYMDNKENVVMKCLAINKIPHQRIQHYVQIEGSPTNYSLMCLEPSDQLYHQGTGHLLNYARKLKDSIGFDGPQLDAVFNARALLSKTLYINFFQGEDDPELNRDPEMIRANLALPTIFSEFQRSGNAAFWADVYKNLTEERKNSWDGRWLKELVNLCVGQPFPPFTLPAVDNKPMAVKDLIAKSKVTLVHFWASHSYNRKDFQDELRVMYKKYHDQGLNIIGVSTDYYKEDWEKILNEEPFPWPNVIDAKGQMVEILYHEHGIKGAEATTNVLIDAKGKILAWDINGVELEWQLWKAFAK